MVWCKFKHFIHRKDAEIAEELFFSFAAERAANENPQSRFGVIGITFVFI
jgi:hypothetical protein